MSIFNSLGSNYNFKFVMKTLGVRSFLPPRWDRELKTFLEEKYGGYVTLLYKGREAIELGLQTLNLPAASYVAINGFTCFAVYKALKNAGLNIEFLDIEKGNLNFSAETFQKAVNRNPKIKAVIIQNTLGYPCDIEKISGICKKNNIILIEDLAHSVGTKYANGQQAGTVGDMTVLSFSQDKIIDGVSGGALITKIPFSSLHPKGVRMKQQIIDRFYPLFTFVIRKTYPFFVGKVIHEILKKWNLLSKPMPDSEGFHQLPSWYASLISLGLKDLENDLFHRKEVTLIYAKLINPQILSAKIVSKIYLSANLRFPIFVTNREGLIKYLAQNNIFVSDIWYDSPVAPKKYLSQTDYKNQCPNSELTSFTILNLPTHKNISEKTAEKISQLINKWLTLK